MSSMSRLSSSPKWRQRDQSPLIRPLMIALITSLALVLALSLMSSATSSEETPSDQMLTYSITSYLPTKGSYQVISSYDVIIYHADGKLKYDLLKGGSTRKLVASTLWLPDGTYFLDHIYKTRMRLEDETKVYSSIANGVSSGRRGSESFKLGSEEVVTRSFKSSETRSRNQALADALPDAKAYRITLRGEIKPLPGKEPMIYGNFVVQGELVCSPDLPVELSYPDLGGYLILLGANLEAQELAERYRRTRSGGEPPKSEDLYNLMKRYVVLRVAPMVTPLAIAGYVQGRLESQERTKCLLSYYLFQSPLQDKTRRFLQDTLKLKRDVLGYINLYVNLSSYKRLDLPDKLFQLPEGYKETRR